jgi:AraC-like DNA-binding protein
MATRTFLQESVRVRRVASLRGTELLEVENTDRQWKIFNTAYCVAVPRTWHGEAIYRRRKHEVTPGMVFCTEPGEIHTTPRVVRTGSFSVFIVEPAVLCDYLSEYATAPINPEWRVVAARGSPQLLRRMAYLFKLMQLPLSAMALQSAMVSLVESVASELVQGHPRAVSTDKMSHAAARIRECLHEEGAQLDLEQLAAKVGMSRFQVLRVFKRRYGLPPHSYQLCVKIAIARKLLGEGHTISDIAAECGFADQSHLSRHFRRAIGVTPSDYLRAQAYPSGSHSEIEAIAEGTHRVSAMLLRSEKES